MARQFILNRNYVLHHNSTGDTKAQTDKPGLVLQFLRAGICICAMSGTGTELFEVLASKTSMVSFFVMLNKFVSRQLVEIKKVDLLQMCNGESGDIILSNNSGPVLGAGTKTKLPQGK